MNVIQRYEHEKLLIGEEGFKKVHWDAFVKLNMLHEGKYFEVLHNGLKFNQFVGVLQIDGVLVQINPKADKGDDSSNWQGVLLEMLTKCGRLKAQTAGSANVSRKNLNLLEVYFELYLFEIEKLIRQGMIKQYRKESSNVKALKGKLEFAGDIRHNLVHKERFYTSHQVYDTNHLIHQILLSAIDIVEQFTKGSRLYNLCKRIMLTFPDVERKTITAKHINSVVLNRKTAPYSYAFELARLIILNYSPDISHGRERMLSLLFDMNQLWEEYVLVMLRKYVVEHREELKITGQSNKPFWGSNSLRPDIEIYNKETKERIIIDTKWKRPGNSSASVQDLRQMYAYSRFWDAEKVMLLYPGNTRENKFKPFDNEEIDQKKHQCKMGFISVLNKDNNLNENVGVEVLALLESEFN